MRRARDIYSLQEESWVLLCISANLANSGGDIFFSKTLHSEKRLNIFKNYGLYKFNYVDMMILSEGELVAEK